MKFKHTGLPIELAQIEQINRPEGRLYQIEDKIYPSITTVLGYEKRNVIEKWRARVGDEVADAITNRAGYRGSMIHDAYHRYINNEPDYLSHASFDVKFMFGLVKPYLDANLSEIYCTEQRLYSHYLKVAGTVDLAGKYNGVNSVIDYKTTRNMKFKNQIGHYFAQAAGYCVMIEELTGICVPQIVIIMTSSSELNVFVEKRDNYIPKLQKAIKTYYDEVMT